MEPEEATNQAEPRSILVVLPTWVGDFVMSTPALRAIRNRFASSKITFLLEANLIELASGGDWMDECLEWPAKGRRSLIHREYRDLLWELRRCRFDLAILLSNSFRAALLTKLAGVKKRSGYNRDGRGLLLTDRLPVKSRRELGRSYPRGGGNNAAHQPLADPAIRFDPHAPVNLGTKLPVSPGKYPPQPLVEYYADLVEFIGCQRPTDDLELFTTEECDKSLEQRLASCGIAEHRPLVVISPGGKFGAAKCWSPERFAGVAQRLVEQRGATVIVTCGPGEQHIARQIRQSMRSGHHERLLFFDDPLLSLGQLKSLIRRCDLLVCNDAGPRHFAKAFDVAVVTVFGPTHPLWTETRYRKERIVRVDVECGPCQQRTCPLGHLDCMTGVTIDAVFSAASSLLPTSTPSTVAKSSCGG